MTATGLTLCALGLLVWAGTALAATAPADPLATTTSVPDTTTSVPDTTPTTQPPPPPTQPPPPPPTQPPVTAPAQTPPPPSSPRSTPRRPGTARAQTPSTVTAPVPPPPAISPPSAASTALPAVVLGTTISVPDSIAEFALAGTTRSTLPPDFAEVQPVSAFVPPTGFSPGDVLVLALAAIAGFGLVAWEVVEESQWST